MNFEDTLDAVSELPPPQQQILFNIMGKRLIENKRKEIAKDAAQALKDFEEGKLQSYTPDELIQILHESLIEDSND